MTLALLAEPLTIADNANVVPAPHHIQPNSCTSQGPYDPKGNYEAKTVNELRAIVSHSEAWGIPQDKMTITWHINTEGTKSDGCFIEPGEADRPGVFTQQMPPKHITISDGPPKTIVSAINADHHSKPRDDSNSTNPAEALVQHTFCFGGPDFGDLILPALDHVTQEKLPNGKLELAWEEDGERLTRESWTNLKKIAAATVSQAALQILTGNIEGLRKRAERSDSSKCATMRRYELTARRPVYPGSMTQNVADGLYLWIEKDMWN